MPYTPPAHRSPASSKSNSPNLSRNESYDSTTRADRGPTVPRSQSATYIHKHRRSPSISDKHPQQNDLSVVTFDAGKAGEKPTTNGSVIPTTPVLGSVISENGLTMSPVDSGSSEEEEERGRGKQLRALAESLRETMPQLHRVHSPDRSEVDNLPPEPEPTPALGPFRLPIIPPALTPEAKKIAHSRSASEIPFLAQASCSMSSPGQISPLDDGSSDDEGLELKRVPLIRKKSGELVKPALRAPICRRPSSAPGTPTYSKAVHFNDNIEQVRHFLQLDRPMAVSAGSSPVETYDSETDYPFDAQKPRVEWEIRTSNFPKDPASRRYLPIRVERISLSSDKKHLLGVAAVANIAFHKLVVARFTFDYWKTTSEVVAEYTQKYQVDRRKDGYDRFEFSIKLSDQTHLETKTLLLCVRYNVDGKEFWDNNSKHNFQVDFTKKIITNPQMRARSNAKGASSGRPSIPRSRNSTTKSATVPRPRSYPSATDDEFKATFTFGASTFQLQEPSTGPRMKKETQSGEQRTQGHSLSGRYNFRSSLSAALSNAQSALGDKSGISLKNSSTNSSTPKSLASQKQAPVAPKPAIGDVPSRPDNITSVRPELHSAEYNDLIRKFCYVGRPPAGLVQGSGY